MRFARFAMSVLALAGLAAGCAPRTAATRGSTEAVNSASASTVVTAQELARLVRQGSLLDALERLRPFWLVSRGTTPLISIDGSPLAELSLLRTIPASAVREVRLQRSLSSAGRASIMPNGDVIVGDVIAVSTRQGGRPEQ